jgi:hypothetical protein
MIMLKRFFAILLLLISFALSWAAEIDTLFHNQFRKEIGGWIAADATYSILLPDGRTLWLFGDTFIGEVDQNNAIIPGSKFIRNSGVIQEGDQLETLFGGTRSNPSDFIPTSHPDSTWYWPEHGVVENDTLRIFVAKFRKDPDGPPGFKFAHAGNDIANFTYPGLEFINSVPVHGHEHNGVIYGDRVLVDTAYVYIYGRRNDDPGINIPYPHVARAHKDSVMNQRWKFYSGGEWSSDPQETMRINSFQVSQQYSVTSHKGKYILLTQDIWLSPKIWTFTSSSPVGPWTNKKRVYKTPESDQGMFTYNAYAHPQFDRDGELLISYNTNGDFWSIFSNVELYRPRFIRVPYWTLDLAFWPTSRGEFMAEESLELKVFPHPVVDQATLSLDLKEACHVAIDLVDVRGRLVFSLPEKYYPSGVHYELLDMKRLPEGIYLCRVAIDADVQVIRVVRSARK